MIFFFFSLDIDLHGLLCVSCHVEMKLFEEGTSDTSLWLPGESVVDH